MITFHPTISFRTHLHRFFAPAPNPQPRIEALFPGHSTTLTDSGRSALALIIETLGLEHKRMALPAFLCNNILPVLKHYHIEPVFLDIDPLTYQPTESAYETPCDAALIVATYGKLPNPSVTRSLRSRGTIVVEDWAHVPLPTIPVEHIDGDARYYSLSKTLPVPDGGLAVIPTTLGSDPMRGVRPRRYTLTAIKDLKKIWWFVAYTLALVRIFILPSRDTTLAPSWHGVARIRPWSRRFLGHALNEPRTQSGGYCYPIRVDDPQAAQRRLFDPPPPERADGEGIITERLWEHPIIDLTNIDRTAFPNTDDAARHTLCVPLWHIKTDEEMGAYQKRVSQILDIS